jgi:hypothetical protein
MPSSLNWPAAFPWAKALSAAHSSFVERNRPIYEHHNEQPSHVWLTSEVRRALREAGPTWLAEGIDQTLSGRLERLNHAD